MVTTINMDNSGEITSIPAVFSNYYRGSGDIQVIASTTGAVADVVMPCSAYLMTNPPTFNRIGITHARIPLAQITGYQGVSSVEVLLK